MASSTSCAAAFRGASCPRICPRKARSRLFQRVARQRAVRQHQPPLGHAGSRAGRAGSLAQRRRARQPECEDHRERRPAGLRRGQEGEGAQAPGPGGHGWPRPGVRSPAGRRPGPRRGRAGAQALAPLLPVHRQGLRRRRLCRRQAASATFIAVEIVRKRPGQVGFVVHPRRWVVERFFAWISRNRRLWKDPEATIASAKAFLYAASVMMLLRRIGCAA